MHSEKIAAQEFAVRLLESHIKNERFASTYLLTGQKESGKEELALALAAALNCEKTIYFQACECGSCHKIEGGTHPDVRCSGEDPKMRSIKIEEIRDILNAASLKSYEGKWKVFIFYSAEKLTADASNALLKTLEEPPPRTLFILTAESRSAILETIQSRSFEIRLKPLARTEDEAIDDAFLKDLSGKTWEDFFDEYAGSGREEIKGMIDSLMRCFRDQSQGRGEFLKTGWSFKAMVRALDLLTQTKEALDANTNQKLLLSRLAMRLRKLQSPQPARVS